MPLKKRSHLAGAAALVLQAQGSVIEFLGSVLVPADEVTF